MKISATVTVQNRLLPSLNLVGKRSQKSVLQIGKLSNNEIYILHQTLQNQTGQKYKVMRNIRAVHSRFISDGKATVSFVKPEHDLCISCDPIQLKAFLHILKMVVKDNRMPDNVHMPRIDVTSKPKLKILKTELCITGKQDYHSQYGFSRCLTALKIIDAELPSFDRRILRLPLLRILHLEGSKLEVLPEALGSLPLLTELYLKNNELGKSNKWNWKWILSSRIRENLKVLDLSYNMLTKLPILLTTFKNLEILDLKKNKLHSLPMGLGNLLKLTHLSLEGNQLQWLPGSISRLHLDSLNLGDNDLAFTPLQLVTCNPRLAPSDFIAPPSLLNIAAKGVVISGIKYSEESVGRRLVEYLEDALYCRCGSPVFSDSQVCYIPFDAINICKLLCLPQNTAEVCVAVRYCSYKCYEKEILKKMS